MGEKCTLGKSDIYKKFAVYELDIHVYSAITLNTELPTSVL